MSKINNVVPFAFVEVDKRLDEIIKAYESSSDGGSPAYGYEMVKEKLIKVSKELEIIEIVKSLRDKGMTPQDIANELNAQGIHVTIGKKWYCKPPKLE